MAGRMSSSTGRPFRSRLTVRIGAASTLSTRSCNSSPAHPEHLQLPITRCYLLLERTLRYLRSRAAAWTVDPFGQQGAQRGRAAPSTGISPGPAASRRTSRYSPSGLAARWAGPARS